MTPMISRTVAATLLSIALVPQAFASTIVPAHIESVTQGEPQNGMIQVTVTYIVQRCRQKDLAVFSQEVPPFSLAYPQVAVGALLDDLGIPCMGPSYRQTGTLELPAIAGHYQLRPIQPKAP